MLKFCNDNDFDTVYGIYTPDLLVCVLIVAFMILYSNLLLIG